MFSKFFSSYRLPYFIIFRNFATRNFTKSYTYYDVLKLPKDCSTSDIRNSYIKLSKQYHPDKNAGKDTHNKFVRILEAYKTLSNPSARSSYDCRLSNPERYASKVQVRYEHGPYGFWHDDIFWENRDRSKDGFYASKPYYGIKGIKKMSNAWIVFICCIITILGVFLQVAAIYTSVTLKRDKIIENSNELEKIYSDLRSQAMSSTHEEQIEMMKKRLRVYDTIQGTKTDIDKDINK